MALNDISDPSAIESAIAEFDALGREQFLSKYGFRKAQSLLLEHEGKTYDSKAILGAAHGHQFPELGPLSWHEFAGGANTAKKVRELGFNIVSAATVSESDEPPLPIGDLIDAVLELQPSWSSSKTPEMVDRGKLVRTEIPKALRAMLPTPGSLPYAVSVEGSDGAGSRSRVPWVRLFSEMHSPKATNGWYVVLLFAADGSAAYLSLGSGTSEWVSGGFKARDESWLADRVAWARDQLGDQLGSDFVTEIELHDPGLFGPLYERGTVFARRYGADDEIEDDEVEIALSLLLDALGVLYTSARPMEDDEAEEPDNAPDGSRHLLLKWSPDDPETVDKHLAVAAAHGGAVWWGSRSKTIPPVRIRKTRVNRFRKQIADGVETYAYVYRTGPSPAVWRARLDDVTNDRAEVDEERVPAYYGPEQHHRAYALLREIQPYDLDLFHETVVLAKNPIAGSLGPALKNQTSPIDVMHLGSTPEPTVVGEADTGLSKEWLLDETLWMPEALDELLDVLLGPQPQVILAGPPGTGKTWIAKALARYLTKDRHAGWRLVQFHPSYSYESFVEGLRPVAEHGAIKFDRVDGAVLRMAKAAVVSSQQHVLIVDELNRANIPRVLGELMFLFEYRNETIDLQFTPGFALPKNIAFIATMNTADRSIRSIDVALRRRFEIFECLPDPNILAAYYAPGGPVSYVPDLIGGFVALNEKLTEQLDRHHTIGHTFFMAEEMTVERLRRVWERKIAPLIEEYFFDAPDLAEKFALEHFWSV